MTCPEVHFPLLSFNNQHHWTVDSEQRAGGRASWAAQGNPQEPLHESRLLERCSKTGAALMTAGLWRARGPSAHTAVAVAGSTLSSNDGTVCEFLRLF